jgi:sec-independent protein translocase protein TatB
VRKYINEVWDEDDEEATQPPLRAGLRPLEDGELPPYDADAT